MHKATTVPYEDARPARECDVILCPASSRTPRWWPVLQLRVIMRVTVIVCKSELTADSAPENGGVCEVRRMLRFSLLTTVVYGVTAGVYSL